ncbi:UBTD2 [Cordylochernes scorpioides]|uniref:UBTD2 n=1 Tax=Cordylochernes scorpioides TaxID=51811 RepID=A0ABY6L3Z9_9ARAC|nr:UBTD2 [Cordylochernes scorpioides]
MVGRSRRLLLVSYFVVARGEIALESSFDCFAVEISPACAGKNQHLKTDNPKWRSDVPLTDNQLQSKRNEFWDTAPAFEGRKEIWDALKAAAHAAETHDFVLAQAIVDGANISLPNGNLLECYDELGNRYQLPVYCLSAPVNLVREESREEPESPSLESEPAGLEIAVKLRLSTTGQDTRMVVRTGETVLSAKRRLQALEGIEPARQRWFFSGRLLGDKLRIEEAKLQTGFVIQVVVAPS